MSNNRKTGPIPVSMSPKSTCPSTCELKGKGCYARFGPINLWWEKVSKGKAGSLWKDFLTAVRGLPHGQLWRHNQAGDLPGIGTRIDSVKLAELVGANKGKHGFTYTHKPLTSSNLAAIQHANANGFTINVSADNMTQADAAMAHKLPTVVVVAEDAPRGMKTPAGHRIAICPAQLSDHATCMSCQLCSKAQRDYVIGFRAHGVAVRMAEKLTENDRARMSLVAEAVKAAHSP